MKSLRRKNRKAVFRQIVRSFDLIFCSAVITSAFLIPYRRDNRAYALGTLAFFGVFGAILLFAHRRHKQEEEKRRRLVRRQIQFEKLMLVPDETLQEALDEPDLYVIRNKTIDQDSALDAIRSSAKSIACIGELNGTERLFRTYTPETKLISFDELVERVRPSCSGAEIEARLHPQKKRRTGIRSLFKNVSANKYLLLGIVLYALSFILPYQLYYRLIGSLCFGLSALTTVFRTKRSI